MTSPGSGDRDLQDPRRGRVSVPSAVDEPSGCAARGIKNGDIVSIFNERGTVLAGAYVTQRIIARGRRHRSRGEVRPDRARRDRSRRGHQHHRAAQLHIQEHGGHGGLRVPRGGGEDRPRVASSQVSGGFRPGVPRHGRAVHSGHDGDRGLRPSVGYGFARLRPAACAFRRIRPPIPVEIGHLFGLKRPAVPVEFGHPSSRRPSTIFRSITV